MKATRLIPLIGWILFLAGGAMMSESYRHIPTNSEALFVSHAQRLPGDETILRSDAVSAMRNFKQSLNLIIQKPIANASILMFVGGALLGISSRSARGRAANRNG